jgi:1-acylglycerone phosphate reductase
MELTVYEAPAIEANPASIRKMFDANVFGVFEMVTAFVPLLLASVSDSQTPPTIINTSSVLSRLPYPFAAGYNASKAAIASYSDTLRIELAPLGIKVVTLFMGEVSTGLMLPDNISFGNESLYIDAEGGVHERSRHHVQNSMKPEEFARQVVNDVMSKPAVGKGEFLWRGTNASLIWFLNAVGWRKVFDGTVMSGVGLDKKEIKKAIFDKGQHSSKQD